MKYWSAIMKYNEEQACLLLLPYMVFSLQVPNCVIAYLFYASNTTDVSTDLHNFLIDTYGIVHGRNCMETNFQKHLFLICTSSMNFDQPYL